MKLEKMPKIVMWVLMALCIIAGVMFFFGGTVLDYSIPNLEDNNIPRYTDLFLYLNYIMVCIAIVITLCVLIVEFAGRLKNDPKKALMSLIPVVLFILVFVVTWTLGSTEKLDIIGYEGTDNQGTWARLSDMILYSSYTLFVATVLTIIGGAIYSRVQK